MYSKQRFATILGILFLLPCVSVADQCVLETPDDASGYLTQIAVQRLAGCFRVGTDVSELGKKLETQLRLAAGQLGPERQIPLLQALEWIRDDASQTVDDVPESWKEFYRVIRDQLDRELQLVYRSEGRPTFWEWRDHASLQDPATQKSLIDYKLTVQEVCRDGAEACESAAQRAVQLNRYVGFTKQVLEFEAWPRVNAYADELAKLAGQWDYYFDKARSQYWWELWLNSRVYRGKDGELAPPPSSQFILLHPTVALEYVGGGAENEQAYDVVALVEILGYNRFGWKESRPLKMPVGFSVVATYTPDNTGDRVGVGLLMHAKNTLSLGFTRRDTGAGTDTTWLVSADLLKVFLKKSAGIRGKLRCGTDAECMKRLQ